MSGHEKLRVSVDLDDVVVPTASTLVDIYNAHHGTGLAVEDWNTNRNPDTWGVEVFTDAVTRVNEVLASDEFVHTVEPMNGADKVFRRLGEITELLIGLTGRPDDISEATDALLNRHYPGVFTAHGVHYTDFYNKGTGGLVRDKLVIASGFGITHHVDDHMSHALPLAAAGIRVPLYGDYPWNRGGDGTFPNTLVRVGDMDGLGEYFEDEYELVQKLGSEQARSAPPKKAKY